MREPSVEENTLGIPIGREGRRSRPRGFRRASRTVQTARRLGLGTEQLGGGLILAGTIIVAYNIWRYAIDWDRYADPPLALGAWLVFLVTVLAVAADVWRRGVRLRTSAFVFLLVGLGIAEVLSLNSAWGTEGPPYPTAAIGVGAVLLAVAPLRETRDVLVATVVHTLALSSMLWYPRVDASTYGPDLVLLSTSVIPPLVGVFLVRSYRRLVQFEVDRVLVQSNAAGPQYSVGMLASEELAQLDLIAERLLEDVASGEEALPLQPEKAALAGDLATQLRRHLMAGRGDTWLVHAIAESELLSSRVFLSDPEGLAGRLDASQRDGLLSALWMMLSATGRHDQSVRLTFGPRPGPALAARLGFPIVLQTSGVPRRKVDPATWESVKKVGRFTDSTHESSLRIVIDCVVEDSPVW